MENTEYRKPLEHVFTTHLRQRFAERVLQVPKKTNMEEYELKNRKNLNFEIKKRILGAVVIDDSEIDSMLRKHLQERYGHVNYQFYLNGNVIFVAMKQQPPVFVTCYKKDGRIGAFHFAELYNKYYHTGKLK